MSEENSLTGDANSAYFQDVEGEQGKKVNLENAIYNQFVGVIYDR